MAQDELFTAQAMGLPGPVEISGFHLQPEYLSCAEEQELLQHIDAGPWQTDYRRRIQQFGLGYSSGRRQGPTWLRDLPDWLTPLAQRVTRDAPLERFPENCVINEYIPPLGIGAHTDYDAFGPTVACVSLISDIVMEFRHPERGWRVPITIPARSFWVITGEARSVWEHSIPSRLRDMIAGERRLRSRRVSVTFRTSKAPIPIPKSLL